MTSLRGTCRRLAIAAFAALLASDRSPLPAQTFQDFQNGGGTSYLTSACGAAPIHDIDSPLIRTEIGTTCLCSYS